jgi:AraC family transcriptional regulator
MRAAPGAHPSLELTWIEAGHVEYEVGRERIALAPGDALVVPAGVEHATRFPAPMTGMALHVSGELLAEIGDVMGPEVRGLRPGLGLVRDARRIVPLARMLRDEIASSGPGSCLAASGLAEAVVVELLRVAPGRPVHGGARDPRIARALDRIHASYAEPLTIDDLARTATMSRFHFSRLFRDTTGDAPYKYLVRVRVARAAELLRAGRCSVTEAALSCGFVDLSRFSRTFRAEIGVRPVDLLRARPHDSRNAPHVVPSPRSRRALTRHS